MNNDRELLELAARAIGAEYDDTYDCIYIEESDTFIDPLDDDGDALRLAVKLHIDIRHFMWEQGIMDCLLDRFGRGFQENIVDNPYAATRRAITRAAAEIGRIK